MINEMNISELVERKFNQIDAEQEKKEADRKAKNKEFLESAEWQQQLEEARNAKLQSFTVIFRDSDDSLKESWHYIDEKQIDYIKAKYKKEKKDVIRVVPKELAFGQYLQTISGSSK